MQIRRHTPLFAEWSGNRLQVLAPVDARTRLAVGDAVRRLLDLVSEWTALPAVLDTIVPENPTAAGDSPAGAATEARERVALRRDRLRIVVKTLLEHGILDARDDDQPLTQAAQPPWGTVASLFHRHTRDAPYITDPDRRRAFIRGVTSVPPPEAMKSYPGAPSIPLPRNAARLSAEFGDVLLTRRTHREFTEQPVSLVRLATLLQMCFGPQQFVDGRDFGTMHLRTSPNAGGRQEIEAYVLALNVEAVPAGLYHYNALTHSLELLNPMLPRATLRDWFYHQPMADTAPLVCFTTAVADRIAYKYSDGRAYRLWLYNIGHLGQTFVLTATALGLGAFQTAAFHDSAIDAALGVDGEREFVTYALGCGHVHALGVCDLPPPPLRLPVS